MDDSGGVAVFLLIPGSVEALERLETADVDSPGDSGDRHSLAKIPAPAESTGGARSPKPCLYNMLDGDNSGLGAFRELFSTV